MTTLQQLNTKINILKKELLEKFHDFYKETGLIIFNISTPKINSQNMYLSFDEKSEYDKNIKITFNDV